MARAEPSSMRIVVAGGAPGTEKKKFLRVVGDD
jgi:hypothetical protein